jgi:CHAD domain-containing protein
MAFEFKRKESVRKAVKRFGCQQIEQALADLKHCHRLEAVHKIRKKIKALRALLRLVRDAVPRSDYRACCKGLREAADLLSGARDAHVKVNALACLIGRFRSELGPRPFRETHSLLAADCREQQAALSRSRAPAKVERVLRKLRGMFASLDLKRSGWRALGPGIRHAYRDGRRGFRLARTKGIPENFHEWRKRAKDLFYQIELLCPIWPEQMEAVRTELKQLGQLLGDDHDLFLLSEPETAKRFRKRAPAEAEALEALVAEQQRDLRQKALALGARFYHEKPDSFCKRLAHYWKRWRTEPKWDATKP